MKKHDLLIIGAGLTGMRAAIECIQKGIDVALVSKLHPLRSHSCAAQGGINAALGPKDSWQIHAYDTIKGADFLGDEDAIELMAQEAPGIVMEMDRWGCPFSRVEGGQVAQRPFGGQSVDRTCYSQDRTGQVLLHTLWEQLVKAKVPVYEEHYVMQLVKNPGDGHIAGVVAYDIKTGAVFAIQCRAVFIATGGFGRVYISNTNAVSNTGDGVALALRAGAALGDMEFVQFHPTGLLTSGILISEAVRGEGGFLINALGERFMHKYAPAKQELASRDVVARAEQQEILEGRGVNGAVFLDLRHLGRQKILERLPQIRMLALDLEGVDCIDHPIPVRPTNHYSMGGIRTDMFARTHVPGLYAAGEAACASVHGANRLGGNSLLDTIVFGKVGGAHAASYVKTQDWRTVPEIAVKNVVHRIARLKERPNGGLRPYDLHLQLAESMHQHCGVFRTREGLQRMVAMFPTFREQYEMVHIDDKSERFNIDLLRAIELRNLIDIGECIAMGALARQESRGAHFRIDFPERDDVNWRTHTLARWDQWNERINLSYELVRTLNKQEYFPSKRVY